MAAHILAPIAQLNTTLLTTVIHPTFFPYPLLACLHAARISLVHRAITKKTRDSIKPNERTPTPWAYDIAGYLIMCWGGALITNYMIGQTPVQLLSIHPLLNYVGVHLFITFALRFVSAPAAKTIDTTMFLIDGSLRMHAVISSIGLVTGSTNPAVRSSLPLQVIMATVGATGGGQLAGMLGVHSPSGWSLHTPPALKATSIVEVIDVIMAFVCALVYGLTTISHPSYAPVLAKIYNDSGKPLFTPLGARAACTLLFSAGFAYRATVLHWVPATTSVGSIKDGLKAKTNGVKR